MPEFSPVDVIEVRMADLGLSRADLELSIGQKGRVSEILAGKRELTLPMIVRLSKQLMVPAEMLMPKIPLRAVAQG